MDATDGGAPMTEPQDTPRPPGDEVITSPFTFAATAETIVLALEGRFENFTVGRGTVTATDFDGDTVTAAANGLVITVDDDTPIATLTTLTGTVDEDGVTFKSHIDGSTHRFTPEKSIASQSRSRPAFAAWRDYRLCGNVAGRR